MTWAVSYAHAVLTQNGEGGVAASVCEAVACAERSQEGKVRRYDTNRTVNCQRGERRIT